MVATVTITPEAAERRIEYICRHIDQVRESSRPDDQKAVICSRIDAEIRELVKVTGPRKAVGTINVVLPKMRFGAALAKRLGQGA